MIYLNYLTGFLLIGQLGFALYNESKKDYPKATYHLGWALLLLMLILFNFLEVSYGK